MRLVFLLVSFCVAVATLSTASAATYKVRVEASLTRFVLGDYGLNEPNPGFNSYTVTGSDDPVLENYPFPGLVDRTFSNRGSIRFSEVYYGGGSSSAWLASDCKGLLALTLCGREHSGRLSGSFIDLAAFGSFGDFLFRIDTERGTIYRGTDEVYFWTNSLGTHFVSNGEDITHRIDGISIAAVPIPPTGVLLLLAVVGLGGARLSRSRSRLT